VRGARTGAPDARPRHVSKKTSQILIKTREGQRGRRTSCRVGRGGGRAPGLPGRREGLGRGEAGAGPMGALIV
jgi:hypothetical protein